MIPLRDENPTRRFPWMTILLILANIAVFAYEITAPDPQAFVNQWAFVPARFLADPFSPTQWATVFTAMFMHAGFLHIGSNLLYLWIFGNNVEDRLGHFRYLAFYLSAGVAATMLQGLINSQSAVPNLGASGAIAGVLGGYLLLFPRAAVLTVIPILIFIEIARIPAAFVIGFWFVLQLVSGLASIGAATAQTGGVAFFAHIGGFIAGALLMVPVWLAGKRTSRFRAY